MLDLVGEAARAAHRVAITATAGEGGSITPAGEVSVKEGASQTFAIAAQYWRRWQNAAR